MKKALFVIPTLRIGGAEKALVSLLKSLDPERLAADLFLFEHGGALQKQIPTWVNILPENKTTRALTLELRTYWKDLLISGQFGAAFERMRMSILPVIREKLNKGPVSSWALVSKFVPSLPGEYDVVIGFLEGFTDFFALEKVNAKKKIAWIHSDLGKHKISPEDIDRYRQIDAYATITEACRQSFSKAIGIPAEKVEVVENIVSSKQILDLADAFNPPWEETVPHILTVGRLEYQKGSDIGLEACRLLSERGVRFCWHFIGCGSLQEKLKKKSEEYGLEGRCVFEGQKENPYPYMKRADIIVQPSRVEGKSIVLDEAKILGKAIIVSDYPSATDQIENGVTGMIAKTSPEAIATSIANLLQDDELRCRLEYGILHSHEDTTKRAIDKFYSLIGE